MALKEIKKCLFATFLAFFKQSSKHAVVILETLITDGSKMFLESATGCK